MFFEGKSFYFIGIGGVSMSALARLLRDRGCRVRGSDQRESAYTRVLRGEGIPVSIGEDEEIFEENVVFTGAVAEDHPQLSSARAAGKRLYPRAKLLGEVAGGFPHVVSVAGCHGKTSTSSMLAHILRAAEKPFTCHIGGEDPELTNYFSSTIPTVTATRTNSLRPISPLREIQKRSWYATTICARGTFRMR